MACFARQLGTNNLPDCSNMCHESSGSGSPNHRVGKATVKLEDFDHADSIFVIGQNPAPATPACSPSFRKRRATDARS